MPAVLVQGKLLGLTHNFFLRTGHGITHRSPVRPLIIPEVLFLQDTVDAHDQLESNNSVELW